MKKTPIIPDLNLDKQIYLDNRQNMIDKFREALAEKTEFAIRSTILYILQQEEFIKHITKNNHAHTSAKEENKVLQIFLKEAQETYGTDYNKFYAFIKMERNAQN